MKIRIGEFFSEHFKEPFIDEEDVEELSLLTELDSTATPPPPSLCCKPAKGFAISSLSLEAPPDFLKLHSNAVVSLLALCF